MKLLNRLLLINWHYIIHQTIDFKRLNFLTGKNGSGKSTIIDALQLLVLGDTSGYFFNKAANDQSKRTLKGYLRGEIAENEEEGTVYLRNGDFSSYIVGEFYDTIRKEAFCLGVVFDSYADGGKEEHRFFYLRGELPGHHFILDQVPMDIRKLREWAYQKAGRGNFQFFESNASYREAFRHHMGGLGEKFFTLFRKAVPFSPIMDIQEFIANFVCNVPNKVEIDDMRENIRYYKQLEGELELVKGKIAALAAIDKQFGSYREEVRRLEMQRFLVCRAEQEKAARDLEEAMARVKAWEGDLADLARQLRKLEGKKEALDRELQEALMEKARSEAQQRKENLEKQLDFLRARLKGLEENQALVQGLLRGFAAACRELAPVAPGLAAYARSLEAEGAGELAGEFWAGFQRDFQEALDRVTREYNDLLRQVEEGEARAEEIRREISQLRQGIKPYSKELQALARAIEGELSRGGRRLVPQVFADLLEIRNPKWRDAIEGYLHTQKFYLLVEPQDFVPALKVYDRLKFEGKFYDLGLVDVAKLMAKARPPLPGSLAAEVETANPYARAYADYLLGRVMKVERVEDLRLHKTAITPTCMLYQNYVARQLNPQRYSVPYIGKKSIEEQIAIKEQELAHWEKVREGLRPKVEEYRRLSRISNIRPDDLERISRSAREKSEMTGVREEIRRAEEELARLDLARVYELEEKIRSLGREIRDCEEQWKKIHGRYVRLEEDQRVLSQETIPRLEEALRERQGQITETYDPAWLAQHGEPRFQAELARLGQPEKVAVNFSNQLQRTESQRYEKWNRLVGLRADYNRDYRGALDVNGLANDLWTAELARLTETSLPEYEDKIRRAKEKAQREFQEDFISKLRQNIETVLEQIEQLNKALKDVPFGRNRYRFKVSANQRYKEFYDMIMDEMLMEGYTLFSNEFQSRYRTVVDQLFSQIVATSEGELSPAQREELERNLLKYTDYRTYLEFDLLDIDEEGRESRLSRTISKKSGGETQTPFYIAVLASFLQAYRVNQASVNNTLRLIVFDEAYSKMDHQRIQESMKLLREVGLQVLISAPTEKIADIAPYVERNLCVTRVRQETVVKAFDPREIA